MQCNATQCARRVLELDQPCRGTGPNWTGSGLGLVKLVLQTKDARWNETTMTASLRRLLRLTLHSFKAEGESWFDAER